MTSKEFHKIEVQRKWAIKNNIVTFVPDLYLIRNLKKD